MPSLPAASACTHDLGPGTTICLRCRQEERQVARTKQQRVVLSGGAALAGFALLSAMVASAIPGGDSASTAPMAPTAPSTSVVQQGAPAPSAPTRLVVAASADPRQSVAAGPSLVILVREGRSEMPDGIIVDRAGDSVVVDFDTDVSRTRRRDKFEMVVRRTLPTVYGENAAAALDAVPQGALLQGELLTELPARGVHLPLATGWTLDLWPETRPGRDGPLVVSYRVKARRS